MVVGENVYGLQTWTVHVVKRYHPTKNSFGIHQHFLKKDTSSKGKGCIRISSLTGILLLDVLQQKVEWNELAFLKK